jgi:hypothetical protein
VGEGVEGEEKGEKIVRHLAPKLEEVREGVRG